MKAIFETRADSEYDDDIVRRYHFPGKYLGAAQAAVGDWVIYREPKRGGGSMSYIATARVAGIDPDPGAPGFHYARLRDFRQFDGNVPMKRDGVFHEKRLRGIAPRLVGPSLRGTSIRNISDEEFAAIMVEGLRQTLAPENAVRLELDPAHVDPDTLALLEASPEERERRIEKVLVNKRIRDAAFRRMVCEAYDDTCAVTGLRIVNGGGKAEAQAAHIVPVAENGPDVVQNGIALSSTAHWLFDRHLISLTDDFGLLVSHNKVPAGLRSLFENQLNRIHLPKNPRLRPHLAYVQRHREAFVGS